jgi:PAS domain S-box-containing protein
VGAHVLVVDDNTPLAENLRLILEGTGGEGTRVTTVTDGQTAVSVAERDPFDVAIVDVKLPDGNGVDLLRRLRHVCPLGEVVLLTGFATVDSAIAALSAGAFAFLLKSFRPEEVIATVEQALAKVTLVREREELERRQRALIETAGVLIVGLDASDRIALFNPKLEALTTGGLRVAVGRPFLESWIGEADRDTVRRALAEARRTRENVEVEATFVDGGGTLARRIVWHLSAVQAISGASNLVFGIGIDVTDRRALEKRAAEAEALSAMGSLALGLAHEIRNPLNAAVLQLHLLGRAIDRLELDEPKSSMRRRVEIVGGEIGRLERLLSEFLELARPRGIHAEKVDLVRLCENVVGLEQEALAARHITFRAEHDGQVLAVGDTEKLKQVLINLVVNGRDALGEGGTLTVRVLDDEAGPGFEVVDDGPGIEPAILEDVFTPFFTTKEAGTGLGLSIVRKIVAQHGGTIDISSAPGKGTRVVVRLQRALDEGAASSRRG